MLLAAQKKATEKQNLQRQNFFLQQVLRQHWVKGRWEGEKKGSQPLTSGCNTNDSACSETEKRQNRLPAPWREATKQVVAFQ